jgi:3'(2'), 5'-bisphosphate nucleotidase
MLAEGRADLHVRYGRTMTWDIAAGEAILAAAGGKVLALSGRDLMYHDRSADFANPPFVAASRPELAFRLLDQIQRAS